MQIWSSNIPFWQVEICRFTGRCIYCQLQQQQNTYVHNIIFQINCALDLCLFFLGLFWRFCSRVGYCSRVVMVSIRAYVHVNNAILLILNKCSDGLPLLLPEDRDFVDYYLVLKDDYYYLVSNLPMCYSFFVCQWAKALKCSEGL